MLFVAWSSAAGSLGVTIREALIMSQIVIPAPDPNIRGQTVAEIYSNQARLDPRFREDDVYSEVP
jgi:hypothetical protein